MTPSEFSRCMHFNYVDAEMLRGTSFYNRQYASLPMHLARQPVYVVSKILKREFAKLDALDEFQHFVKWANHPLTDHDLLYPKIKAFNNMFPTFPNMRYMVYCRYISDSYVSERWQGNTRRFNNLNKQQILQAMQAHPHEEGRHD